jgi:RNA polymerase sigma-70 factor (ECF subfamily)
MLVLTMAATDGTLGQTARLLALAGEGDARAQREFFTAHRGRVARLVLRLTGNPAVVDDLTQEVFVAAFAALPQFRGDSRVETWLHTITVNKTRSWFDSTRRRERREAAVGGAHERTPEQPDELVCRSQHRATLYAALEALAPELREAFVLRAIEGLSLKDTAAITGDPVSTVSFRTRKAERLLCERLGLPSPETTTRPRPAAPGAAPDSGEGAP